VKLFAVLLALALALPAGADEGELHFHLVLHGRYTDSEDQPQPTVLFDPSTRAFNTTTYLAPQGEDDYFSTFVSAGVDGRRGHVSFAFTADSGEVRSQSFPLQAPVCFSSLSASGLDVSGSGRCNVVVAGRKTIFPIDETRLAQAEITSNGRSIADEASATLFIREAWVGLSVGRNDFALFRIGRKRFTVADGFVYDDWGTGVETDLDLGALGPSYDVGAALFYPTRDVPDAGGWGSVLLSVHADYLPGLFEHAGVFAAYFRDRANAVVELFRGSLAEPSVVRLDNSALGQAAYINESRRLVLELDQPLNGSADLGWAGTSGAISISGVKLEFTGALAFGQLTIPNVTMTNVTGVRIATDTQYRANSLFGELAHLRLRCPFGSAFELGGFFVFLSGDQPPMLKAVEGLAARYGGFLGVSPYVTDTNIFFNGGISESFAARQATAPGVNGRGVIAPGLTVSIDPFANFGIDARAAYLVAPTVGPFGGRVYGPEVDLELTYALSSLITLAAEGDVLFPGDFFPAGPAVTKLVLGVDLVPL
jgi:hypothetical protein